jgi:hypothetical protein
MVRSMWNARSCRSVYSEVDKIKPCSFADASIFVGVSCPGDAERHKICDGKQASKGQPAVTVYSSGSRQKKGTSVDRVGDRFR